MPDTMPVSGLITEANDLRLGIWIMPDNSSSGMLENFLHYLIPDTDQSLWNFAKSSVDTAKINSAPFRDVHLPKAEIHTWLAWQDPPGERFGIAITKKFLDPHSTSATAFVDWFKNLFGLNTLDLV